MRELGPTGARLVVVGVDGSSASVEAARYGADEAAARGLDLLVVHACRLGEARRERDAAAVSAARTAGRTLVDDVLSHVRIAPTTVVRTVVEVAPAAVLLTGVAGEAALLVLGQHHADLADGHPAGHVAQAVAGHAGCPVVVVPAAWVRTVTTTAHLGRRPIVVGVGGNGPATSVLRHAFEEAELRQASVLILHASTGADVAPAQRAVDAHAMAEIVAGQQQDHPDVAIDYRFVPAATVLTWVDASSRACLMVVGRPRNLRGRRSWEHSVARAMLQRARCPLAVVPPTSRTVAAVDRSLPGAPVLVP